MSDFRDAMRDMVDAISTAQQMNKQAQKKRENEWYYTKDCRDQMMSDWNDGGEIEETDDER